MTSTVIAPERPRDADEQSSSTTLPAEQSIARLRRAMCGRRALIAILVLVVGAGLFGLLGVHSSTASVHAGGYTLRVHYASIARPGVTVPLVVTIERDGAFEGPIHLAISSSYLDALDVNTTSPEPASSTANDKFVVYEFDRPSGGTLQVSWQAQVDPSANMGRRHATVAILDEDRRVTSVSITTMVLP